MATDGVINGTKFGVYVAGTKVAYATSASISMNHNLRDTSTKDSGGWRDQLEGQRDWEVSVEGMLIFTNLDGTAMYSGSIAGTNHYLDLIYNSSNNSWVLLNPKPTVIPATFPQSKIVDLTADLASKLASSSYTAADVKSKLLTVDGSGSGIDADKLAYVMDLKNVKRGRISEYVNKYPNAVFFKGEKPWSVSCDVALPCATQNELNGEHAKQLVENGCICVAEGANMPSTPEAIYEFQKSQILFAPGKASNAGGVATSGLEMSQNSLRLSWTREEVDEKLKQIMKEIHESCVVYGKNEDGTVDYIKGANIAGFVKVADAMLAQGIV